MGLVNCICIRIWLYAFTAFTGNVVWTICSITRLLTFQYNVGLNSKNKVHVDNAKVGHYLGWNVFQSDHVLCELINLTFHSLNKLERLSLEYPLVPAWWSNRTILQLISWYLFSSTRSTFPYFTLLNISLLLVRERL